MTKALQIGQLAVLLAGAAFFCVAAYELRSLAVHADRTLLQVDVTLDTINRPCSPSKPCGTLADVNRTLQTARLTMGTVEVAGEHYDRQLYKLDSQEAELAANLNGAVTDARTLLLSGVATAQAATATIQTANTTIQSFQPVSGQIQATLTEANTLLGDPAIPHVLSNLDTMTTHADGVLFTTDLVWKKATRNYLYPSKNPWARGWQDVKPFVIPFAQISGAVAIAAH